MLLDSHMEKKINSLAAEQLRSAGVQVKLYPGKQVLHAKMIVTDHVAIVCSTNGSYDAFTRNHELYIVTNDTGVVKQAQADFDAMFAK